MFPIREAKRPAAAPAPVEARCDDDAVVDCALYVDGVRQPAGPCLADLLAAAEATPSGFVWIGLHEPSPAKMAEVAKVFDLHPWRSRTPSRRTSGRSWSATRRPRSSSCAPPATSSTPR
ncbi:hypothetical protein [Dactylosporangium darangshiense]|uniref:hypothetical protein n=1 Tax=Dactylosporangium darangshiense TaxID=579108 RepID=UPI0036429E6A